MSISRRSICDSGMLYSQTDFEEKQRIYVKNLHSKLLLGSIGLPFLLQEEPWRKLFVYNVNDTLTKFIRNL